jgi:hypothetical protein
MLHVLAILHSPSGMPIPPPPAQVPWSTQFSRDKTIISSVVAQIQTNEHWVKVYEKLGMKATFKKDLKMSLLDFSIFIKGVQTRLKGGSPPYDFEPDSGKPTDPDFYADNLPKTVIEVAADIGRHIV